MLHCLSVKCKHTPSRSSNTSDFSTTHRTIYMSQFDLQRCATEAFPQYLWPTEQFHVCCFTLTAEADTHLLICLLKGENIFSCQTTIDKQWCSFPWEISHVMQPVWAVFDLFIWNTNWRQPSVLYPNSLYFMYSYDSPLQHLDEPKKKLFLCISIFSACVFMCGCE